MDVAKLTASLMSEEGLRLKPYADTAGKLTIGYGRNLTDKGISEAEAADLLQNDINDAIAEASEEPWWPAVASDDVRARAMVDMVFNLGLEGVREFHVALAALASKNFGAAADAFADSEWDREVAGRADRLIAMIRTGQDAAA